MSESIVQKKLSKLIQQEVSIILTQESNYIRGALLTVSVVRVTADLGLAKIYVSVLPDSQLDKAVEVLNEQSWEVRHLLARKIKNKVRNIPEIRFYKDDSFKEAEKIDQILRNLEEDSGE